MLVDVLRRLLGRYGGKNGEAFENLAEVSRVHAFMKYSGEVSRRGNHGALLCTRSEVENLK